MLPLRCMQLFPLPRSQAAAHLQMSDNCLKRLCRKFGISRWPYRKLASLDALAQTLKSDGGKDCEVCDAKGRFMKDK